MLATPRLRLRPLAPSDAPALSALWTAPEVARILHPQGAPGLARVDAWMARAVAAQPPRVFALEAPEAGGMLGYAGVQALPETGEPELFYALLPDVWGRGLATEACRAVVTHARVALGLARLVAVVEPGNARSLSVVEKLGFERAGEMLHAGRPHLRYELRLTSS